jgi:phosphopantothenoylcysteine decarboxylase / phosphopantothenate---cysteine ligase
MALTGKRILLGITGGIAAYKAAHLARLMVQEGAEVDAVLTRAAREFVGPATFAGITGRPVRSDLWAEPHEMAHLRLGRSADAVVVAVAERHGAATIATLDRRHFSVVRPSHVSALTLLP